MAELYLWDALEHNPRKCEPIVCDRGARDGVQYRLMITHHHLGPEACALGAVGGAIVALQNSTGTMAPLRFDGQPNPVPEIHPIAARFRGFLPAVVDIETGGFNSETDAMLEIAIVTLSVDAHGRWHPHETFSSHVDPFPGANIEQAALDFNGIIPDHPLRFAVPEKEALQKVLTPVRHLAKETGCTRAVLVGHNPAFDLSFLKAAVERCKFKRNPFHLFTTFDTATLGGLAYGQTVLARAVQAAGISWDQRDAHSAIYDAERTAELFCKIVNRWGPI